ncbi:MAG: zinc dependent phospholipase C family protein [Deltaproteobacteria bacterium]|nr:zinc dependent phospholipase C family protein [Deltaproteobacteria bacterium]MBN2846294.1 zinc dependent phospholipase C family protein [Deltaproteobacteria bacterium]
MPKENTHIFFAEMVRKGLENLDLFTLLSREKKYYYLGAVMADTFFYGKAEAIVKISDTLHGKDGNPTNEIIIDVLKKGESDRDLAHILGYITHCALDMTFHPVIYYLTGNYYTQKEMEGSVKYRHRYMETCLDIVIGNTFRMHSLFKPEFMEGLIFESLIADKFSLPLSTIRRTFVRQMRFNRCFTNTAAYLAALVINMFGLLRDPDLIPLFYRGVRSRDCGSTKNVQYRDLVSGEKKVTSVTELFELAKEKAQEMMIAAYEYSKGAMTLEECMEKIPGESLDTGLLKIPVSDIRYTAYNGKH